VRSLGRWDDIFFLILHPNKQVSGLVLREIAKNITTDNLLCKWLPRKGEVASVIRAYLKLTPKDYRQLIVSNTKVVEQLMSLNKWDEIEFSKIPGQALANYMTAFNRNASVKFHDWVNQLTINDVKAKTMYPHQITEMVASYNTPFYQAKIADILWSALPDYMNDANVLAIVDVSGSMDIPAGGQPGLTCMHISKTLGLYIAHRTKGIFKNHVITFSDTPELVDVSAANISDAYRKIGNINWGASTDFEASARLIAKSAKTKYLMQEELPTHVIVFSDMQFNMASETDKTYDELWVSEFTKRGYIAPTLIFWNLAKDSTTHHTLADSEGFVEVGGYSVNMLSEIFNPVETSDKTVEMLTPVTLMERVIMKDRYKWN
jgi:hypothetical protein